MDNFYNIKNINEYTFELNFTIPKDSFNKSYNLLLQDYSKDMDVKGFRKGRIPENMISKDVKEAIKLEAFERLAPLYINTALDKEKIEPIAPPQYKDIPKILEDLDVPFSIIVTTMPKFKLGDIKKIDIKKESVDVDEKEIQNAIDELKNTQKTEEKEINDKWAEEIGKIMELDNVKGISDLKEKIKDVLIKQKEHYQVHQLQDEALRKGIEISNIDIPKVAIDFEASEREKAFTEDMKSRNVKIEDFLKANNITIEKMRELWQKDAKDALEADTFLNLYSNARDISVSDEELDNRITSIKESQPSADKDIFSDIQWREYIRNIERKEKGFKLFIEEVLGSEFIDEHN